MAESPDLDIQMIQPTRKSSKTAETKNIDTAEVKTGYQNDWVFIQKKTPDNLLYHWTENVETADKEKVETAETDETEEEESNFKKGAKAFVKGPLPWACGCAFAARVIHVRYCLVIERFIFSAVGLLIAASQNAFDNHPGIEYKDAVDQIEKSIGFVGMVAWVASAGWTEYQSYSANWKENMISQEARAWHPDYKHQMKAPGRDSHMGPAGGGSRFRWFSTSMRSNRPISRRLRITTLLKRALRR